MTAELNQSDYQAVADLENVLCILKFERKKETGGLTAKTIAFIEGLLGEYKLTFLQQKDDLKSFAQNAKKLLSELLAHQPLSDFVGIASKDNCYDAPARALDAQNAKQYFEATKELANKIVNHFTLLEEEQKKETQNPKNINNKNDKR
jgi:hypothetical protein